MSEHPRKAANTASVSFETACRVLHMGTAVYRAERTDRTAAMLPSKRFRACSKLERVPRRSGETSKPRSPPPMHQAGSSTSARTTCGKFQSQSRRRSAQESVVGSSSRSTSNEPVFPCSTQPVSALLCPMAQCSAGASAARSSPAAASDRPTTTPAAFAASFRLETRFTRIMLSLAALRTSWR